MKNFPMENLTELSPNELTTVEGGGLLNDVLVSTAVLLLSLPNTTNNINTTLKGLLDRLF